MWRENYFSYSDFPTYGVDSTEDYLKYKREQVARFSNIVVDTRTGSVRFGDSESLDW